jgi:hypothetical protein
MPRATKIQTQSDLIYMAEELMEASFVLEDDPDMDQLLLYGDQEAIDTDLFVDDTSEILEISALNWAEIAAGMSGDGSRGTYDRIPKSADFFSVSLQAPDWEFRHMFRCESVTLCCFLLTQISSIGRDMFDWVVGLLARNPIFQPHRGRPQRHVKYQLGCFLIRYGAMGSDTLGTAQKLSIGFGTVFLYCNRGRRALRELRSSFIGWPSPERKLAIKTHIKDVSGFSRCLGAGDGSLINFDEIPKEDGPHYMSRKKRFGVNSPVPPINSLTALHRRTSRPLATTKNDSPRLNWAGLAQLPMSRYSKTRISGCDDMHISKTASTFLLIKVVVQLASVVA